MTSIEAVQEAGRIRLRPDSHDLGRDDHGRAADRAGTRRRLDQPPPAGLRHRRRRILVSTVLTLYVVPVVYTLFDRLRVREKHDIHELAEVLHGNPVEGAR